MTENKRYYTELNPQNHYEIYDSQDKYEKFYPYNKGIINKICDLLNEQEERIKQQEELISEQAIQIDYLQDENKHMKDVLDENKQAREQIRELEKENMELQSIKKFAEKNGICIFNIDEAFRKCWKSLEPVKCPDCGTSLIIKEDSTKMTTYYCPKCKQLIGALKMDLPTITGNLEITHNEDKIEQFKETLDELKNMERRRYYD